MQRRHGVDRLAAEGLTFTRGYVTTAICSHKAPAAFSIGAKFIKYGLTRFESLVLIVLFACVTPLGICIGLAEGSAADGYELTGIDNEMVVHHKAARALSVSLGRPPSTRRRSPTRCPACR